MRSDRPQDYALCENCGRVCSRETLKPGPGGLMLGPECYKREIVKEG